MLAGIVFLKVVVQRLKNFLAFVLYWGMSTTLEEFRALRISH